MATTIVEDRISEIDRKLDLIVQELGHLKQARNASEDLLADLMLVAKDAYKEATGVCGTIELRPEDIVQLFKVGLSNANLLTVALQQLESASDFLKDVQPVTRDLYRQALVQFQSLQERGYFNAAATGARIADTLVQAHSAEDLKRVEASIPYLVGFLRELTHPEVLQALEAIIHGFGRVQATMDVDKSVFQIARELNSPDARRGIGILTEFLKVVGARGTEPNKRDEQPKLTQ
ncbi:MAG: DUF1641 domain-containing protein [Acidobacteriaceae bacterium]